MLKYFYVLSLPLRIKKDQQADTRNTGRNEQQQQNVSANREKIRTGNKIMKRFLSYNWILFQLSVCDKVFVGGKRWSHCRNSQTLFFYFALVIRVHCLSIFNHLTSIWGGEPSHRWENVSTELTFFSLLTPINKTYYNENIQSNVFYASSFSYCLWLDKTNRFLDCKGIFVLIITSP